MRKAFLIGLLILGLASVGGAHDLLNCDFITTTADVMSDEDEGGSSWGWYTNGCPDASNALCHGWDAAWTDDDWIYWGPFSTFDETYITFEYDVLHAHADWVDTVEVYYRCADDFSSPRANPGDWTLLRSITTYQNCNHLTDNIPVCAHSKLWVGFRYHDVDKYFVCIDNVYLHCDCSPPASGDECDVAIPIACGDTLSGDTAAVGINNTYNNGENYGVSDYCLPPSDGSGSDMVYELEVPDNCTELTVTLTNTTADLDLWIGCSQFCGSAVAAGDDSITLNCVPDLSYFIYVDSAAGQEGQFDITVNCTTPCTPVGEFCGDAIPIAVGETLCFQTFNPACMNQDVAGGAGNPDCTEWDFEDDGDLFYTFTISEYSDVEITVDWILGYTTWYYHVNLVNENICDGTLDGDECVEGVVFEAGAVLSASAVAPGTYYIWFNLDEDEAPGSWDGMFFFNLILECNPVDPGDSCGSPFNIGCGDVNVAGDTSAGFTNAFDTSNIPGGCVSGHALDAPDIIYQLHVTQCMDDITVTLHDVAFGKDLVAYVLAGECGAWTGMTPCAEADDSATLAPASPIEPNDEVYIVVDGKTASDAGSFELDVACTPSHSGDGCFNPIEVTCGNCYMGNTSALCDCHAWGQGPDVVFHLTGLTIGQVVWMTGEAAFDADWIISHVCSNSLDPDDIIVDYGPAEHVDPSCGIVVHHAQGYFRGYLIAEQTELYVWIAGWETTDFGNYALEFDCWPPGDLCSGQEVIVTCPTTEIYSEDISGAMGYHDDYNAADDYLNDCMDAAFDGVGFDKVYKLTLPAGCNKLSVSLTNPDLDVYAAWAGCFGDVPVFAYGHGGVEMCVSGDLLGDGSSPSYPVYIMVDGHTGTASWTYDIIFECGVCDTGVDCGSAITLPSDAPLCNQLWWNHCYTVDPFGGGSDCVNYYSENSLFYTFTLAEGADVAIAFDPIVGFNAGAYHANLFNGSICTGFDPADCLASVDVGNASSDPTALNYYDAVAGTYYLVISFYDDGTPGNYLIEADMELTLTPLPHDGDVDGDGSITPNDSYQAVLIYLGIDPPGADPIAADYCPRPTGDGIVDPGDAYAILKVYLGIPNPCG